MKDMNSTPSIHFFKSVDLIKKQNQVANMKLDVFHYNPRLNNIGIIVGSFCRWSGRKCTNEDTMPR